MSFSKAKLKRFNDARDGAPPVKSSTPKHPGDVRMEQADLTSAESRCSDGNTCGPVLFTMAAAPSNANYTAYGRRSSSSKCYSKRRRAPSPPLIRSNTSPWISVRPKAYRHEDEAGMVINKVSHDPRDDLDLDKVHAPNKDTGEIHFYRESKCDSQIPKKIRCLHHQEDSPPSNNNNDKHKEKEFLKKLKQDLMTAKQHAVESKNRVEKAEIYQQEMKNKIKEHKEAASAAVSNEQACKKQLNGILQANVELHKQLENARAEMDTLKAVKTESQTGQDRCHELEYSLEAERKNLVDLQTKVDMTEAELIATQISFASCKRQLEEEKSLGQRTIQELKECEARNYDFLVNQHEQRILELETQLMGNCELLQKNKLKLEMAISRSSDLEQQLIKKDEEIEQVTDWGNDWKRKYDSCRANRTRSVIGLGAAEVLTLGAFSYIKWKYG